MSLLLPSLLQEIIDATRASQGAGNSIYLVGGAVRDLLLRKEPHDFDFVMSGNVRPAAKKVADRLGGFFYMLDEERSTARVLFDPPGRLRVVVDFSALRGLNIEEDLKNRDFTINAMALDIAKADRLLDPLGGAMDLKDGVLRICAADSFENDPARLLRAIRQAVEMELRMTAETVSALRKTANQLQQVTPERQRDELFRMLEGRRPQVSLRLLDSFNLMDTILPELGPLKGLRQPEPHVLDAWEHTLAALEELNILLTFLTGDYREEAGNLTIGSAVLKLGRYRTELGEHFRQQLNPNRARRALLNFALLYHDTGKPDSFSTDDAGKIHFYGHEQISTQYAIQRSKKLALSQDETDFLSGVINNHMRVHQIANSGSGEISGKALYRYYRATGEAGIDTALAALADTLATWRSSLRQEVWVKELDVCRTLFDAWWEKRETVVQPVSLINGHDIQNHFKLKAGPWIGKMLEAVRETQASGELETREDALRFLDQWIEQQPWRADDGNLN